MSAVLADRPAQAPSPATATATRHDLAFARAVIAGLSQACKSLRCQERAG